MATALADNVISFVHASKLAFKRTVKPESVGVINDCRDLAVKRICAVLSQTFNKIEDELFQLAESSFDRVTQNFYLDARAQAREKRSAIETAFRKQFLGFFEQKVTGEEHTKETPQLELSLVDNDVLEEDIAITDIARRLTEKCDAELRDLSQRMSFLLSDPEMKDEANPVSPDTIVRALKAACDQLSSGHQTRLTVMRLMEQHMAKEMLSVYHDLNSHLVAHHVLPQIRPMFRTPSNGIRRAAGAPNAAGVGSAEPAQGITPDEHRSASGAALAGGNEPNASPSPAEIYAALQQLLGGGGDLNASGAQSRSPLWNMPRAKPGAAAVTTGSFAPLPPGAAQVGPDVAQALASIGNDQAALAKAEATTHALLSMLSDLQHQVTPTDSGALTLPAVPAFIPGQTPIASLNVLREIKSHSALNALAPSSPVDAMTIDIVAMLFDYVFDDKAIPDTIKALLARLQIPILKVAILDKSFFAKKAHPARRLLDALAEASVAFAGEANHDDPLYICIEHIVDRVQREFDTEVDLFASVLATFEQFLCDRDTANAEMVERSARALHDNEKREMARLIAIDEIERRVERDGPLPAAVVAMLRGPWTRTLERVYLNDGGRNQHFADTLLSADELIWSVLPKAGAEDRKRLVRLLPPLLKRLQQGLEIAAIDKSDRDRFFTALVDCHAAAVRAGLRGEGVSHMVADADREQSEAAAPLFAKLIAEESARAETMRQAKRTGIARILLTDTGINIEELTPDSASSNAFAAPVSATATSSNNTQDLSGETIPQSASPVELKRGAWVEFIGNAGDKIRAKLSWISPLKGVYLFTSPGTHEALSIAPQALQLQFRNGQARVLEESSLIDRAVDKMVQSLASASR